VSLATSPSAAETAVTPAPPDAGGFLPDLLTALEWLGGAPGGVLQVRSFGASASIYLAAGSMLGASGAGVSPIGERMRARGVVSARELRRALKLQAETEPRTPLGDCLARVSRPAAEALQALLREQCVDVLRACAAWELGSVEFEAGLQWAPRAVRAGSVGELMEELGAGAPR